MLSFSVPGGTEKIAGLWFAIGGSVPRLTLWAMIRKEKKGKRDKLRKSHRGKVKGVIGFQLLTIFATISTVNYFRSLTGF